MKIISSILLLVISNVCYCQNNTKIDTSNYYDYSNMFGTIAYLHDYEVAPIIEDEIIKAGYDYPATNQLMKFQDGQYITLTIYEYHLKFGFLYIKGHHIPPDKNDRKFLLNKDNSALQYGLAEINADKTVSYTKINHIPDNIFVLDENCYWYYSDSKGELSNSTVSKNVIIEILRQDIRMYLARLPKPVK